MAKKSANPVDAFRKAQRAKELKKNKEIRKKSRESQAVKQDTRELESEIKQLKSKLGANAQTRLADLEKELAKINKIKENYVAEHPEARDRVFRTHERSAPKRDEATQEVHNELYDDSGRLRDPTRSIYYDPVYNPFGVPPPGMAYKERTPEIGADDSEDDSEEEDSDDEIVLPAGPPPGQDDSDSDDSDDIPLPSGPPPPRVNAPGLPSQLPIPFAGPPISMGFGVSPPFPPQTGFRPEPPAPSFPHNARHRPPPNVQDPLSDGPTQTYQGYRMAKHDLPARPSDPAGPSSSSAGIISSAPQINIAAAGQSKESASANAGSGEISAAPVMRDLRKEATAFVPRGVKRKKEIGGMTVNAAPGSGMLDADGDEIRVKREEVGGGLLGKLKGVLSNGQQSSVSPPKSKTNARVDDDYQKFLDGLGDLK
ncbi:hypothetical protein BD324DRAFT_455163 [Kockovaella imperatae]|uniref:Wbp11/ELF5/Saf1 N-terminal domain-containing protein n=1 Tax=Kockovaella imperatae TaxID=4999 RepID=A0A1Y1UGD9_9TREE|nr:hypothetical protein BD324DRAFT_455163 [Kockovaella imperatae]ORX36597.1 hypothetical protein BD324DRAFT_455163 [Kockovaella imperatae]